MALGALGFFVAIDQRFELMIALFARVLKNWHGFCYPLRFSARRLLPPTPFKINWCQQRKLRHISGPGDFCVAAICRPLAVSSFDGISCCLSTRIA